MTNCNQISLKVALLALPLWAQSTLIPAPKFSVKSFGAAGDGSTNYQAAFQRAADATHSNGGGSYRKNAGGAEVRASGFGNTRVTGAKIVGFASTRHGALMVSGLSKVVLGPGLISLARPDGPGPLTRQSSRGKLLLTNPMRSNSHHGAHGIVNRDL